MDNVNSKSSNSISDLNNSSRKEERSKMGILEEGEEIKERNGIC
jgi:hypothetical protein